MKLCLFTVTNEETCEKETSTFGCSSLSERAEGSTVDAQSARGKACIWKMLFDIYIPSNLFQLITVLTIKFFFFVMSGTQVLRRGQSTLF